MLVSSECFHTVLLRNLQLRRWRFFLSTHAHMPSRGNQSPLIKEQRAVGVRSSFCAPGRHTFLVKSSPPRVKPTSPAGRYNLLCRWELRDSNTSLGACHFSCKPQTKIMKNLPLSRGNVFSYVEPRRAFLCHSCHRLTRYVGVCTPASSLEWSHWALAELGFLKGTNGTLTF